MFWIACGFVQLSCVFLQADETSSREIEVGDNVQVVVDRAPLKSGTEIITVISRGTIVRVWQINGSWYLVRSSESNRAAWINNSQVRLHRKATEKEKQLAKADQMVAEAGSPQHESIQVVNQLERAIKIRESYAPEDDLPISQILMLLGEGYEAIITNAGSLNVRAKEVVDYFNKAEECYQRALGIRQRRIGANSKEALEAIERLGYLTLKMSKPELAIQYHKQAILVAEHLHGADSPEVAWAVNGLANTLGQLGRPKESLPYSKRAFELGQGLDYIPGRRALQQNYAYALQLAGDYAEAYQQLRSYLFWVAQENAKKGLEMVWNNMDDKFAELEAHVGDKRTALQYYNRNIREFPIDIFLADEEHKDWSVLAHALSLALDLREKEDDVPDTTAAWMLNCKGRNFDTSDQTLAAIRQTTDPAIKKVADHLFATRRQLAELTLRTPLNGDETGYRMEIADLKHEENEIRNKVSRLTANRQVRHPKWTELTQLRQAVPRDAVFIDMIRFPCFCFGVPPEEAWKPDRYVAWIIPSYGQGAVSMIDLGEAATIDQMIWQVRSDLDTAHQTVSDHGEQEAEKEIRTKLFALSRAILHPLQPYITAQTNQLLFSPDSDLWLVPWNALMLDQEKYLAEQYVTSYRSHGRDLCYKAEESISDQPPAIVADPDFGERPETGSIRKNRPDASYRLPDVARLPGTEQEAAAIAPSLETYTGTPPMLLRQVSAVESSVKQLYRPRILHVSTHGFFLPDAVNLVPQTALTRDAHLAEHFPESALLRCGLMLAGCNNRETLQANGNDDGIMTGFEVVGMNLEGTELVVLSACETGLGEMHNGQGVVGLRQAFQLAGAKAVVSSLWQVPDRDSALIMADFFQDLTRGQSTSQALRKAQVKRIMKRRDRYGAAHPLFWAAWTLMER